MIVHFASASLAGGQRWPQHMFDGMMGGWWGFGMILATLFWVALLVLIVVLVWRLLRGGAVLGGREDSALEILERRYAAGEIDREEFQTRKRDLGHG